jgi:phenylalanyl-tRNA synthetase beta chain
VAFRPSRVNRLLGTEITPEQQRELLARVGIETAAAPSSTPIRVAAGDKPLEVDAGTADVIEATIPTWRRDLLVEADLAEEIIRVHGYDLVPATLPDTPMPPYRHDPLALRTTVRETLVGAGLTEVVTPALVAPRLVERYPAHDDGALDDEPDQGPAGRPITVTNPLSSQHSVLRQSLIGSLLEVVSTNLRYGRDDIAVFEVGKGYGAPDERSTREWWRLGLALTGDAEPAAWDRPARPYDLDDAKGILALLCGRLGFPTPAFERIADDPNLHPGRAARVTAGGSLTGRLGELHPDAIADLDLRAERVYVAEVAIAGLAGGQPSEYRVAAPSRQPTVERDLAVVVDADRPAAEVEVAIRRHGGPLLRGVTLFDIYRGRPLAETDKSLAYRLTLRDDERTLTEAELDAAVAGVVAGLTADLGARFRT